MKMLFIIFVAFMISFAVYLAIISPFIRKEHKRKKIDWMGFKVAGIVFLILLVVIAYGTFLSEHQPDLQCGSVHTATSRPPANLISTTDYMQKGNYEYDTGNCIQAVVDYTKAIQLSPNSAEAYNNRAYTNMRLRNYADALPDLDRAITLRPNYVSALMNRGDIHNYYYQIDREAAITDYKRVIAITGPSGGNTSVCGHLFLAKHDGWTPGAYVDFFLGKFKSCN